MTILSNARMVLPNGVAHGALSIEDGVIASLAPAGEGLDLEGDFLLPGLIDLHTDNLERQALPRSSARWPSRSALLIHDAQCAAAGITTVFDALCLGDIGFEKERNKTFQHGYADLTALAALGALKTEHFLHLRCELPAPEMRTMLEAAIADPLVRLLSIMDHSPGFGGQYIDIERYRRMRRAEGRSAAEVDEVITLLHENRDAHYEANRAWVLAEAARHGIPVASHDDRTEEDVARNAADGISISEFPVSLEAARAARVRGQKTIAGAPNIVRGGSHSGNVEVLALIRENLLDALASDYVPAAMLEAAFAAVDAGALPLHEAVGLVTSGPAEIAGLTDRGRIEAGLRADLVQIRLYGAHPVVRAVWRGGERIG
jgi:alpha-D-ribose 1-methylphosphonate 5-triphosphate diphosphatase